MSLSFFGNQFGEVFKFDSPPFPVIHVNNAPIKPEKSLLQEKRQIGSVASAVSNWLSHLQSPATEIIIIRHMYVVNYISHITMYVHTIFLR